MEQHTVAYEENFEYTSRERTSEFSMMTFLPILAFLSMMQSLKTHIKFLALEFWKKMKRKFDAR